MNEWMNDWKKLVKRHNKKCRGVWWQERFTWRSEEKVSLSCLITQSTCLCLIRVLLNVLLQAVTDEVYKLLETKCGLHKVIIPVNLDAVFLEIRCLFSCERFLFVFWVLSKLSFMQRSTEVRVRVQLFPCFSILFNSIDLSFQRCCLPIIQALHSTFSRRRSTFSSCRFIRGGCGTLCLRRTSRRRRYWLVSGNASRLISSVISSTNLLQFPHSDFVFLDTIIILISCLHLCSLQCTLPWIPVLYCEKVNLCSPKEQNDLEASETVYALHFISECTVATRESMFVLLWNIWWTFSDALL